MKMRGPATERKISEIVTACERYGQQSIIALSGIPRTGKSELALIAAQRFTDEPMHVKSIQFHPSYSYEEFIEGLRIDEHGRVTVELGVFLHVNEMALSDPEHRYVILIDELTRADVTAVLGEVLTYYEHRDRSFSTLYSEGGKWVAPNLVILATYNPMDRSAINMDQAVLSRLRSIPCPPCPDQLVEMLIANQHNLDPPVIKKLQDLFATCEEAFPEAYAYQMPFGHGVFAEVRDELPDLYDLWEQRIRPMLYQPLRSSHPFAKVIERAYPWKKPRARYQPDS